MLRRVDVYLFEFLKFPRPHSHDNVTKDNTESDSQPIERRMPLLEIDAFWC